jgi:hypothetical protein
VLSDGRLSGRIIYWPGGGKATTTVPQLEPTFFLLLPLPSNAWTPLFLSTCCLLLPLPTSFVVPDAVHQLSSFAILLVAAGDGGGTCSTVVSFF